MSLPRLNDLASWTRSLHGRMLLFFVGLLLLIQTGAFLTLDHIQRRIGRTVTDREQQAGVRVLNRLLRETATRLEQAALALSTDAGVLSAASRGDHGALAAVLADRVARYGLSAVRLVGPEGVLIAHSPAAARDRAFPSLHPDRAGTDRNAHSSVLAADDGRSYQIAAATVRAIPGASIIVASILDEQNLQGLSSMSGHGLALWYRDAAGQWQLTATTLPATVLEEQKVQVSALLGRWRGMESLPVPLEASGGHPDPIRLVPLAGASVPGVLVSVHRALEDVHASHETFGAAFVGLSALGLILFGFGSLVVARRISRTINDLTRLADRVRAGDNSVSPPLATEGALGALADSLQRMRSAITQREERITRLAFHDPLTGLANRTFLMERLAAALADAERSNAPLAVMVMNVDRFKNVNDVLGHDRGDEVLREVARRLLRVVEGRGNIARLGADEFAVALPGMSAEQAVVLYDDMVKALEVPMLIDGHDVDVGLSIGISGFPDHGHDAAVLMREADIAMHTAKRGRAGVTVFDQRQIRAQESQLSILSAFRRAVATHELELFYQPKIDIVSGRLVAAEALVRWLHPVRGTVSPNQFIPFLEQSGHIKELTRWALAAGVRQAAEWHAAGRRLIVGVNISVRDLVDASLPTRLESLLAAHKLPAEYFCLELTESAFMEDPDTALDTVRRLNAIGVQLAIDDYGTGYSSLAYLQRLPVQEIKIDRGFVATVVINRDNRKIVRSTVELGRSLGLSVTAEGVEDEAALEALRAMGCNTAQGYVYSNPLPAAEFEAWMDRRVAQQLAAGGG